MCVPPELFVLQTHTNWCLWWRSSLSIAIATDIRLSCLGFSPLGYWRHNPKTWLWPSPLSCLPWTPHPQQYQGEVDRKWLRHALSSSPWKTPGTAQLQVLRSLVPCLFKASLIRSACWIGIESPGIPAWWPQLSCTMVDYLFHTRNRVSLGKCYLACLHHQILNFTMKLIQATYPDS